MPSEPFFHADGHRFVPTKVAKGPWEADSLHGRVVIGLLAAEIERLHCDEAMQPARLTVDMYRLPGMAPVEVATRMVRDGRRIKVIDAELSSGGVSMARATCQILRRTANPEGEIWRPPSWNVPSPDELGAPDEQMSLGGMWILKPISGRFGTLAQRRMWSKEARELVGGRPLTPFVRVAGAADMVSPFSNMGDKGLSYINTDVTVYLHRMPRTEWVGFETVNHGSTDGIAIGEVFLYDEDGPIGSANCCALARERLTSR